MSGSVNIPAAIGGGVTAGLVLVGVILLLLWRIFYYQVQSSHCEVRGIISSGSEIHSDF